jgi:hypothetical protein
MEKLSAACREMASLASDRAEEKRLQEIFGDIRRQS